MPLFLSDRTTLMKEAQVKLLHTFNIRSLVRALCFETQGYPTNGPYSNSTFINIYLTYDRKTFNKHKTSRSVQW
jgi:hypothetical protein